MNVMTLETVEELERECVCKEGGRGRAHTHPSARVGNMGRLVHVS